MHDRQLERQGRRLGRSGSWWLLTGCALAAPGVILVVAGLLVSVTPLWAVGIVVLLIAGGPAVVGLGLLTSAAVSRWSARRKLFA